MSNKMGGMPQKRAYLVDSTAVSAIILPVKTIIPSTIRFYKRTAYWLSMLVSCVNVKLGKIGERLAVTTVNRSPTWT